MKSKQLILIFIAGVIVVGVGLVVLLTRRQVPTKPLPELPVVEIMPVVPQPEVSRYTLQVPLPAVEKLPVYKYESGVVANFSSRWPGVLGFSGEPQEIEDALEGTLYLWSKEGQTLVINEDASGLSYRVDLNQPVALSGSFLPTFEQAAAIVERTLGEFGVVSGLLGHDATKDKALKTGVSLVQETKLADAELVEVHFTAKVDDYPIYSESGPEWDPVLAWVGRDGKLLRLEYHPLGTLGEKIADYPLKSEEEVLQDLENGKGVVVSSNLEGGEVVTSVTITGVLLGYLLPSLEATTTQPMYVLSGSARTGNGETGVVTIYLEAVSK